MSLQFQKDDPEIQTQTESISTLKRNSNSCRQTSTN